MDKTEIINRSKFILERDTRGTMACVIAGTKVLMKDGSDKSIEDITIFTSNQEGDVLFSIEGSDVFPVAMIAGPEKEFPIVNLEVKTNRKTYNIKVSKMHSFLRNYYSMIQAYLLDVGDKLVTDTGIGMVTSVSYEEYQGEVWNVFLASKELKENLSSIDQDTLYSFRVNSLLGLRPKEHIIFTNGIASGSYLLQMQLREFYRDGININNFS
ncbi:hypothetical protein [Bacillus pumilus]|uniref:hypothetical protein n=1 Tax=Bacillus pumilus TaxID=1408 RepID=UPI000D21B599|nr:hypothetical protein [Bacillus pumilus]AVI41084.1 hypothetical protein C5Y82_08665 [Bacillus pumilus]